MPLLCVALSVAEADPGRAVIIVFSDGLDTASWLSSEQVIEAAKRVDAVVYAVNARTGRRDRLLSELADTTGGRVFDVASPERPGDDVHVDSGGVPAAAYRQLRPSRAYTAGWHKVELRA